MDILQNDRNIISVSELNGYIKTLLDTSPFLSNICVRGEISNFTNHRTGHFYFSLKDEGGLVRAVMFRGNASRLNFLPENGMKVIATGSVSSFIRDGQYQLYVSSMEPDGIGGLYLAYEQLRRKLEAEGLFDQSKKRPIPKIPSSVGVITSPTGAAVRDIINVLGRRFPYAEMILYPSLVQGDGAAPSLIEGMRYFNSKRPVDVIIIGRGGGSIEDLWAFNNEALAREIASSSIPVISAVGHETDFTICDFAADRRAPTPSAAAELAVPDIYDLMHRIDNVVTHMRTTLSKTVEANRQRLDGYASRRVFAEPERMFADKAMYVAMLGDKLMRAEESTLMRYRSALGEAAAKLDALSPLSILSRGYSVASDEKGSVLHSVENIGIGDSIILRMTDGTINTTVDKIVKNEV